MVSPEEELRALCTAGDLRAAATRGLHAYGAEVMSYLAASLRDDLEVREAFGLFSMSLWVGLPRFRWECSFRTWCYALARHAVLRTGRERGRARHVATLPDEMEQVAAPLRTSTPHYLRTEAKRRIAALRADLDPDDRQLLILRINRKLAWDDIARVLCGEEDPPPPAIAKHAAALRKRFERLKARLREAVGKQSG